ncbi:hypothetical protein ACJX0J_006064, partial [Zea mays]
AAAAFLRPLGQPCLKIICVCSTIFIMEGARLASSDYSYPIAIFCYLYFKFVNIFCTGSTYLQIIIFNHVRHFCIAASDAIRMYTIFGQQ